MATMFENLFFLAMDRADSFLSFLALKSEKLIIVLKTILVFPPSVARCKALL